MRINLYPHQNAILDKLKSGSILCGGVGSGKSLTSLAYYHVNECQGEIPINGVGEFRPMVNPKDLYIVTTARKRDTYEWDKECSHFLLSTDQDISINGVKVVIDSWNNIKKYADIKNAFFIFDEQKLVGSGTWVKSFLKIAKNNRWILLSATPGDTWIDFVPVFIANGFYKNRTEFTRQHVVYNNYVKYPLIVRYLDTMKLEKHRQSIVVIMKYSRHTVHNHKHIIVGYDVKKMKQLFEDRWNIFEDRPIKGISELCYAMRRLSNSDESRIEKVKELVKTTPKVIIFYNFNYELDILRSLMETLGVTYSEWNGHKHELIPTTTEWAYLVQYTSGAEGWNCTETDTIIFYSQNYSYKVMIQAAGRIDRLNTKFKNLYYYHLRSTSSIDNAILISLKTKKTFNESSFVKMSLA